MSRADNEETTETEPQSGFQALGLDLPLVRSVAAVGYQVPTPIQAETIPVLLGGRDLLGQAQTGTGKTAAFALPLLQRIDLECRQPQVLVLTPTRELAIQVSEAFQKYAAELPDFVSVPIYGGQDYQVQLRRLKAGVHVVVGAPGRVVDLMRRGALLSESMQALVLDEGDEMLRMGFSEDVQWILSNFPENRQTALFSATLPLAIRQIAQQYLRDPVEVTIASRPTAAAESIEQRYLVAPPYQKQTALIRVLEAEPTDGVLVFVKTKSSTEPLAASLTKVGIKAAALNGDLAQKQRERIVSALKSGEVDVIVATDVAARGLDVQRISHVINFDLPYDKEAYVHRIGRTGRAGRTGQAILFVDPREERLLHQIERFTRQKVAPMEIPSNRKINKQRVARFHERISEAMASSELETYRSILEHYRRENDVPLELIAASLAVIANGGRSLLEKH